MKMGISAAHCYSKNVTHSTSRHGMERTSSKCGSEIDLTKSEIDLLTKSCSPRFGWWGAISVSCILLSAAEGFAEMHQRERLSKFGIDGRNYFHFKKLSKNTFASVHLKHFGGGQFLKIPTFYTIHGK